MLTSKQEKFVRGVVSGLSQRLAYRRAYPSSERWADDTVDQKASHTLAQPKVRARYEELQSQAAKDATLSRSKMLKRLDSLADKSISVVESEYARKGRIDYNASLAVVSATKELLPYAEDDLEAGERPQFVADFGLLLAPDFLLPHRLIAGRNVVDLWSGGGRGSMKSSWASLEVVYDIERNPVHHGLVMMRYKNQLRDSAYAQIVWAIEALGLEDEYEMPESTLRIRKKSTGQTIYFKGCDNPNKVKGVKPPFGYIGIVWLEECDMFRGMAEIRKVLQSATRGGEDCIRIYTFNPPRSKQCWINAHVQALKDDGRPYFESNYLRAPAEWLGKQFLEDAEELRRTDPQAYEHEYMGVPVGLGGDVFERVDFREIPDDEIATFDNLRCGQDFGWWPDPWAFVMSEWRPSDRTLLSFAEDGGNKLQPDEQAQRIRRMLSWDGGGGEEYHHLRIMSDDGNPQHIAAQRNEGIDARAAGKGGLRMRSYEWLASIRWVIDPVRCPRLAEEVRNMQYEQNADGEWLNSIPDGNDHWVDAARYSVMDVVRKARKAYATPDGA